MLLGQTSGQTQLIHEVDGNDILVTIDTSSLRAAASQIQNLTNFFESKKFKLSNFYKAPSMHITGRWHVIHNIGHETMQDAKLTIFLIQSLMNSTGDKRVHTRSANVIGEFISWTTGVAGPRDKEIFKQAIFELKRDLKVQGVFNSQVIKGNKIEHAILNRTNSVVNMLSHRVEDNWVRINKNEKAEVSTINILGILKTLSTLNRNCRSLVVRANTILNFARLGFLTTSAISRLTLGKLIRRIQLKNKRYSPLFGVDDIDRYYSTKLTKVSFDNDLLHVHIHIPLVDYTETSLIRSLTKQEKDLSFHDIYNYDFVAINRERRSYSFLTHADLLAMSKVGGTYISTKRRCEMLTHSTVCTELACGGIPRLGQYTVYNVDNDNFLVRVRDPITALLTCSNDSKHIQLNHTAILLIPRDCRLESEFFNIAASHISGEKEIETGNTFTIQLRHPLLVMLAPDTSANSSSLRDLVKLNNHDLIKLNDVNSELEKTNTLFEWRITRIEVATAASLSGLGLILMIALCCCATILVKNRNTLKII